MAQINITVVNQQTLHFYITIDDTPLMSTTTMDIEMAMAGFKRRKEMYENTNHMDNNGISSVRMSLKCRDKDAKTKPITLKEIIIVR